MIYRIDVTTAPAAGQAAVDSLGVAIAHQIAEFGMNVSAVRTARIFLIDSDASEQQITRVAGQLLADPVVEKAQLVRTAPDDSGFSRIEIHLKPGVMDPVAASTEMAIRDMGIDVREVRTGRAYLIQGEVGKEELSRIASRVLANGVIESIHFEAFIPRQFSAGRPYEFKLRHARIRDLSDEQLTKLSREGHLFLSLAEMKAIQKYYRDANREPTDVELETLAQTWSEHCVHKTLKSAVDLEIVDEAGKVIEKRHYDNLIRDTIFKCTQELMEEATKRRSNEATKGPFCLSVFVDNAGVIAFDETDAVCFKVETHNHPSAIEPYGGSATGIGGVIRDILGTGLAAKPIANTDVFCVAFPDYGADSGPIKNQKSKIKTLPKGVIHPKRILQQIVAGVRDYGNRMGIPTVNGAVYFDNRYLGNPLVFCGCVGLIPRDKIHKQSRSGDAIVVMGGRTGRDGIHGATFSSAELTDTHADEFSHAVQIGNAITEKKMTDVVLAARDRELFNAITDCGAGGLSSAVGEMGEKIGAMVELDKVPLKYAGLRYDEIWISEAQERMVLAVPQEKVKEVLDLAASEDVEATVIGHFGTQNSELILKYRDTEVGRLSMHFLHDGLPKRHAKAVATRNTQYAIRNTQYAIRDLKSEILSSLSHPNIASKHWVIRQYDHEVQGGSVIKPLTGPRQVGPSDAAVLRPKLDSHRGIALGCGMAPQIADPYEMAIASIDEAIRNVVAVGADPSRIAILDNFCWPSVDDEKTMGTLARACEACYDAAKAYGIPFVSGKDSLHNQFTNQETGEVLRIPNTLLISAIAVLDDVRKCVTMDLKKAGNAVALVGPKSAQPALGQLIQVHRAIAEAIRRGLIVSCHDVSDGGALVALAEMAIASGLGVSIFAPDAEWLAESPGHYLVETPADTWRAGSKAASEMLGLLNQYDVRPFGNGAVTAEPKLIVRDFAKVHCDLSIEEMTAAWRGTIDW